MDKYVCACGYVYDPAQGDPENGIAPGTWRKLRDDEVAWLRRMAKLKPEKQYEEE